MAESPCAVMRRRLFPSKLFGNLSKNPVNLSNFIDIFTYYFLHFSCSAPLLSVPPTPPIRTASATCKTKAVGRPSEHAPSSRKHVTANAGSNPTEEGGFADRGGQFRPRREELLRRPGRSVPTGKGGTASPTGEVSSDREGRNCFADRGGQFRPGREELLRRPRREGLCVSPTG